ncbi:MAG: hypothetical protein ACPKNR_13330 [Pleomorphochaeta sp.]
MTIIDTKTKKEYIIHSKIKPFTTDQLANTQKPRGGVYNAVCKNDNEKYEITLKKIELESIDEDKFPKEIYIDKIIKL